jgi:meiotically up-regulated gene 157 (Mug157) protein
MEKNGIAGHAADDNIIWFMRITCWITRAANTHSEYVIFNAFPRQQWLRDRASLLRLYVHLLTYNKFLRAFIKSCFIERQCMRWKSHVAR